MIEFSPVDRALMLCPDDRQVKKMPQFDPLQPIEPVEKLAVNDVVSHAACRIWQTNLPASKPDRSRILAKPGRRKTHLMRPPAKNPCVKLQSGTRLWIVEHLQMVMRWWRNHTVWFCAEPYGLQCRNRVR